MNSKQKKFVAATAVILLTLFAGSFITAYNKEKAESNKIAIITTFYPLEFFALQIGGEFVSVESLVPYNTEVHTWEPAPADILAADDADILIYNGAEVDAWFKDDILPVIGKSGKLIVETTDGIDLGELDDDGHGHGIEDPHTWISPFLAKQQAEKIYLALTETDPDNIDHYNASWTAFKNKLDGLDREYKSSLANKTVDKIFVSHAAFGYLADRYGFKQEGVIGLSADEQPGTATIAGIVEEMIDHDIFVIYIDPVYSDNYARTLKIELEKSTGRSIKILKLYLMLGPIDGLNYFEQVETNLANLLIGLEVV